MAEEKKNSTGEQLKTDSELAKTKIDARDEEILSEDELNAVAGGNDFVGGSGVDFFGKKDKEKPNSLYPGIRAT